MTDILSSEDISHLVHSFYERVLNDPLLAPHFKQLNFQEHMPRMIHFWEFVLLDKPGYSTNVFDKHRHMPIDTTHFNAWVSLWHSTVDDLFLGEKADQAKLRASTLGWTFAEKMKKEGA